MAVSGKPKQDGPLLAGLSGRLCLLSHGPQGMCGLGGGEEAFAARKPHSFGEALVLLVRARLDDFVLDERTERWRVSVIPQSAGMNPIRDEAVSEGEHLHDGAHPDRVAEVIRVNAARARRTRGGLRRDKTSFRHPTLQRVADERI